MIKTFTASIGIKNPDNKLPKYQQLINSLLQDIEMGELKAGERLPSINEASEECYLSRDTVERAYSELHKMGVITSIFRKGYFISDTKVNIKTKILFLVGKISENNTELYNSIADHLGKNFSVDIFTFDYRTKNFQGILNQQLGNYHYYVILPHLVEESEETYKTLKKIAGDRLIVVEQAFEDLQHTYGKVTLSNLHHLQSIFNPHINLFKHYKGFNLVLTEDEYFDSNLITSIRNFCNSIHLDFQVLDGLEEEDFSSQQIYFTLNDSDLVQTIRYAEKNNFKIGDEVGIIALHDSPLKEIVCGGITVISLQFSKIGQIIAERIKKQERVNDMVDIQFIQRKSL